MTFRIIDTKTGKEPNEHLIYDIAVKGNLIACDIDQFAVCEDGSIILLDDCGNFTYCDSERFKVEREALENQKTGHWIEQGLSPYEGIRRCSVCYKTYDIRAKLNYCPNCGAKMAESEDKE